MAEAILKTHQIYNPIVYGSMTKLKGIQGIFQNFLQ